ncbi:hypothetical protein [Streptomyces sp. enrichment culture]|uniref:hypothetical protein n=1 Tax=Streptomyces sp. enrichment culture TaxID=1795815 RepID=UPI003F566C6C
MTARLTAKAARTILDAAELVKAPTWSETRQWRVVSGGQILVHILPSYNMRGRRDGWTWVLAATGQRLTTRPQPTREKAAIDGLAAWQWWTTGKETL